MNTTHTLTRHRDIQAWVTANKGLPAIKRLANEFGEMRARLALRFSKPLPAPTSAPPLDDGLSPVSWTAWLAELDRQQLALKIIADDQPAFEFIERRT